MPSSHSLYRLIREEQYECTLTPESQKKAKEELNEDPKERLACVKQLREWVEQQPHLNFPPDAVMYLSILRTRKFSQLRSREMIDNYGTAITQHRNWFGNVDSREPQIQKVFEAGYMLPLPKLNKNGCKIALYRIGAIDPSKPAFSVDEEMRAGMVWGSYFTRDENVMVNGYQFIMDCTGMHMKHMTRMSMDDMRKWNNAWQNSFAGRFKGFHYYNVGSFLDTLLSFFRPFLKKKFQERIHIHNTAESLYKAVGMEVLPKEYLPDDYTGPHSGTIPEIIADIQKKTTSEEFNKYLLHMTSDQYGVDESKRRKESEAASFRKLNVD